MGVKTTHWEALMRAYPGIGNCVLVVTALLRKEKGESTACTGLDQLCAARIRNKPAYPLLKVMAKIILSEFGLLIVACSHGKHRSVVLANDIAEGESAVFIAPCNRELGKYYYMSVSRFLTHTDTWPALEYHVARYGKAPFPVKSLSVAVEGWNGIDWARDNDEEPDEYHVMDKGDLIIEVPSAIDAEGWTHATIWGGREIVSKRYLPPTCCEHHATLPGVPPLEMVMRLVRRL